MLARQGATQVIFDKDRGLEILVRALGGEYFPLRERRSRPASIRCSCPVTPANIEFLEVWLRELLVRRGDGCRAQRARAGGSRSGAARHAGAGARRRGACRG